jgi:hypothetical protein
MIDLNTDQTTDEKQYKVARTGKELSESALREKLGDEGFEDFIASGKATLVGGEETPEGEAPEGEAPEGEGQPSPDDSDIYIVNRTGKELSQAVLIDKLGEEGFKSFIAEGKAKKKEEFSEPSSPKESTDSTTPTPTDPTSSGTGEKTDRFSAKPTPTGSQDIGSAMSSIYGGAMKDPDFKYSDTEDKKSPFSDYKTEGMGGILDPYKSAVTDEEKNEVKKNRLKASIKEMAVDELLKRKRENPQQPIEDVKIDISDPLFDVSLDYNGDGVIDGKDREFEIRNSARNLYRKNSTFTPEEFTDPIIKDQIKIEIELAKKQKEKRAKNELAKKKAEEDNLSRIQADVKYLEEVDNADYSAIKNFKDFNKKFGQYGFVSIPSSQSDLAIGPGALPSTELRVFDGNGNAIVVDLKTDDGKSQLQDFLKTKANLDVTKVDLSGDLNNDGEIDEFDKQIAGVKSNGIRMAEEWYDKKGLNYHAVNAMYDNYNDLNFKADLIENLLEDPGNPMLYNKEVIQKYPDLFVTLDNGMTVPLNQNGLEKKLEETENAYDKVRQVVGFNFMDDYVTDINLEFDQYMYDQSQKSSKIAVAEHNKVNTVIKNVNASSNNIFGKPFLEVELPTLNEAGEFTDFGGDIKSEADLINYNALLDKYQSALLSNKLAASSYLKANTFYDLKMDKTITDKVKGNFEGVMGEWDKGINNGRAGDVLMWIGLGIDEVTPENRDEIAEKVAEYINAAQNANESLAVKRQRMARGSVFYDLFTGDWDSESIQNFLSDPFEIAIGYAANSMSQMLPYGWKIGVPIVGYRAYQGFRAGAPGGAKGRLLGTLGGTAKGVGETYAIASGLLEYTNAITEAATELEYDIRNPEDWKKALGDDRVWDNAATVGRARGIPIALMNMLAVRLGGKVFGKNVRKYTTATGAKRLVRTGGLIAAETSTGALLGEGGGEIAAQMSRIAFVGDRKSIDWKEVDAEILGSVGNVAATAPNVVFNMQELIGQDAKINLAQDLTETDFMMNELKRVKPKRVMKWVNDMKRTGQIDDVTYQQVLDNLAAQEQANQYIKDGNPEIALRKAEQEAKETAEAETTPTVEADAVQEVVQEEGVEQDTDQTQEEQQEDKQPKKTRESLNPFTRNRKRKDRVRNRIIDLIRARTYYENSKEVYGPQISDINKEINEIVTTGEVKSETEQLNIDNVNQAQRYSIDGKVVKAGEFKRRVAKMTPEEFINMKPKAMNMTEDVKVILDEKTKEVKDAIQKQETGDISDAQPTESVQTVEEEVRITPQETKESKVKIITKPAKDVKTKKDIPPTELSGKQKTNRENLVERIIKKGLKEGKSNKQIVEDVSLKITLDEASKKEVEKFVASRKAGITEETFTDWNSGEVVQEVVQETAVTEEVTESDKKAADQMQKDISEGIEIKFRKQKDGKSKTIFESITEVINSLKDNKMFNELPFDNIKGKAKIQFDKLKNNKFYKGIKKTNLKKFTGVPALITISDTLTVGEITNPVTGEKVTDLKGGLGFGYTEGNENFGWAYTDEETAASTLKAARDIYDANKELYDKLWDQGIVPRGHVAVFVTKMGMDAVMSNEAVYRVLGQNLKLFPKGKKAKAYKALKADILEQLKKAKVNALKEDASATAKAKYRGYQAVTKHLNKYKTLDEAIDNIKELLIADRPLILDRLTVGKPQNKPNISRVTSQKPVVKILMEGLPKEDYKRLHQFFLAEPLHNDAMADVPKRHIIEVNAIDITEESKPVKTDTHPNYPYALKGKSLGVVEETVHIGEAMPAAYANIIKKTLDAFEAGKIRSVDQLISAAFPAAMNNKIFRGKGINATESEVNQVIAALQLAFPNAQFFADKNTWNQILEDENVQKRIVDGDVVYGFTMQGDVYMNPDLLDFNTPIHEAGHLWTDFIQQTDPVLFNKGIELVTEKDSDGNYVLQETRDAVEEYGDNIFAYKEAMATLIGNRGENIVNDATKAKWKNWLAALMKVIRDTFPSLKNLTPKQVENLTLQDFIDGAVRGILSGDVVTKKKFVTDAAARTSPNIQFRKAVDSKKAGLLAGMSVQEIISKGREIGYANNVIGEVIRREYPKMKLEDINNAIEFFDIAQTQLFDENANIPPSFKNVFGGFNKGLAMLNTIRRNVKKFRKEPNIGKKKTTPKTATQIREFALQQLVNHPTYKKSSPRIQRQLQIELDQMMNIVAGESITKRIDRLKSQITGMNIGEQVLQSLKVRIENLIQNEIKGLRNLSKSEVNAALKILRNTVASNPKRGQYTIDLALDEIRKLGEKIEDRQKKSLIDEAIRRFKKLAAIDRRSKRPKSKGRIDTVGLIFFNEAAKLLNAFKANDIQTLNNLKEELFDVVDGVVENPKPELLDIAAKAENGETLTLNEQKILAKYTAFNLLSNIQNASLEQTKNILDKFTDIEQLSRAALSTKLLERAAVKRNLQERGTDAVNENFGDYVFKYDKNGNPVMSFKPATQEEKSKYLETLEQELEEGQEVLNTELDGKVMKLVARKNKKGEITSYALFIEKPQTLSNQEMKTRFKRDFNRLKNEKGPIQKIRRLGLNIYRSFLNKNSFHVAYSKFFGDYLKNAKTILTNMDSATNKVFGEMWNRVTTATESKNRGYYNQIDFLDNLANKRFGFKKGRQGILNLDKFKVTIGDKKIPMKKSFDIIMPNMEAPYSMEADQMMAIKALSLNEQTFDMMQKQDDEFRVDQSVIDQIDGHLGADVVGYVEDVVQYLSQEYFNGVNEVYQDMNFVPLTQVLNYFPRQTESNDGRIQESIAVAFENSDFSKYLSAQFASALKDRTAQSGNINVNVSFFGTLENHFRDMEHFKAYAEVARDMNYLLETEGVKKALTLVGMKNVLNEMLQRTINPHAVNDSTLGTGFLMRLLNRSAVGILAFKSVQILKQASSVFAAMPAYEGNKKWSPKDIENPTLRQAAKIGKLVETLTLWAYDYSTILINPFKAHREARELSATYRDRYDRGDILEMETGVGGVRGRYAKAFDKISGFATKFGDFLGIMGYYANYKRAIKNNSDAAKALNDFNAYNETQQANRSEDLTKAQVLARTNVINRMYTLFASTFFLQYNRMIQRGHDMLIKKELTARNAADFALQSSLLNALFYLSGHFLLMRSHNPEDEDRFWRNFVLQMIPFVSQASAMPIFGGMIVDMGRTAVGQDNPFGSGGGFAPFKDFYKSVQRITKGRQPGTTQRDYEEKVMKDLTKLFYPLTGNTDPMFAIYDYFKDDQYNAGDMARIFGITRYAQPTDPREYISDPIYLTNPQQGYDLNKQLKQIDKMTEGFDDDLKDVNAELGEQIDDQIINSYWSGGEYYGPRDQAVDDD